MDDTDSSRVSRATRISDDLAAVARNNELGASYIGGTLVRRLREAKKLIDEMIAEKRA